MPTLRKITQGGGGVSRGRGSPAWWRRPPNPIGAAPRQVGSHVHAARAPLIGKPRTDVSAIAALDRPAVGSVDLAAPVRGHPPGRSRHRLLRRAVLGIGQPRAVVVVLGLVVPEPLLPGLEALDDRMSGRGGVPAGVLHRRAVA